jgi:AcrR family transcriptional regulator
MPVDKRPAAKPERAPLTRERVLQAALDLADERGIEALSMRELGRRLGVEAMSLYNHVSNKDDVLDGMLDLVVGEIDLPSEDVDWREAMRRRAASARQVFGRHPWAIALNDTRATGGPARLYYFEWMIGTLRRAGFSVELALHAFSALDSYVYGFGRQQLGMDAGGGDTPEMIEAFLAAIPADEFPYIREVIVEHMLKAGWDEDADFEFGLGLILDGLEREREGGRRG